jgi:hypothetical protein
LLDLLGIANRLEEAREASSKASARIYENASERGPWTEAEKSVGNAVKELRSAIESLKVAKAVERAMSYEIGPRMVAALYAVYHKVQIDPDLFDRLIELEAVENGKITAHGRNILAHHGLVHLKSP